MAPEERHADGQGSPKEVTEMVTTAAFPETSKRPQSGAERIVVGVDDTDESRCALEWAVRQAERTGATVQAVHVYEPVGEVTFAFGGYPAVNPITPALAREAAEKTVETAVHAVSGNGDVDIEQIVLSEGSPSRALTHLAEGASMLVVGAHHRTGFGMLLGSTAGSAVRHAVCPVVVVPLRQD